MQRTATQICSLASKALSLDKKKKSNSDNDTKYRIQTFVSRKELNSRKIRCSGM